MTVSYWTPEKGWVVKHITYEYKTINVISEIIQPPQHVVLTKLKEDV